MTKDNDLAQHDSAEFSQQVAEFFDTVPVMLTVSDAAGREIWFNRAWLSFTGQSAEQQSAGRWISAVHPDERDRVRKATVQKPDPRKRTQMRFRMCRHDGQYRWMECATTPRHSPDGQYLGTVTSCLDVHELAAEQDWLADSNAQLKHRLAETSALWSREKYRADAAELDVADRSAREHKADQARAQTEQQFRLLVQGITDCAIFLLDPQGNVTTWNPGAQRIKGYTPDQIIGRNFSNFYTEEDRRAGLPAKVLETAARNGKIEMEGWRVRKDGTRFWADVIVDAIYDEKGTLVGFAKITRDLTARRASEVQSNLLRLLVEGVKDYAIFLLDREGNVSTWNPGAEHIHGYDAAEIIGHNFSIFYRDEDRAAGMPQHALQAARQEERFETENWRVRKDGSQFWASVVIDAIRDEHGELAGFAKITRDLTERRNAEEALKKAREQLFQLQKMEAIGQLTGGVAHDFNNLLTIIIGNVDMANRALFDQKPGSQEKAQRLLSNALAGAKRAANLTQRLLAFARRQPLNPKSIDMNRFIASTGDFLTRTLGEQIHVEAITGGSLWKVEADSAQLESAILNIALNARGAMPEGGKLTIEATNASLDENYARLNPELAPGQYVAISITDTGTGIAPDVMAHIFEPFFTTKPTGQGTGLGLAQVYGFVRQSGGNVKIYSEPGEGTMVKIYLPRMLHQTAEQTTEAETVFGSGGETILVVEDDPAVLDYVTEVLKELNYRVLQAPEGAAAVKILESDAGKIDLLLTDVIMPGISGRSVAEQARRLKPGIKVLFMTGYSQNAIVHNGRLDPGVHLIQKPVTPPELANRVRNLLDEPVS